MTRPTLDDGRSYRFCVWCGACWACVGSSDAEAREEFSRLAAEFALTEEGAPDSDRNELAEAANEICRQYREQVRQELVEKHGEEVIARWWDREALFSNPDAANRELGDSALMLMLMPLANLCTRDHDDEFECLEGYVFTEAGGGWQRLDGEWICGACQTPELERRAAAQWVAELRRQARYLLRSQIEVPRHVADELASTFSYAWLIEQRLLRWAERHGAD